MPEQKSIDKRKNVCKDFVRVYNSKTVSQCNYPIDEDGNCTNETDEHISSGG